MTDANASGLRTVTAASPSALVTLAILAGIVTLGAYLRFTDLAGHGYIFWDEAKFSLEGLRFYSQLSSVVDIHAVMSSGKAIGTAKPSHALLLALGYALFGIHDYSPLYVNAFASLGEILCVFYLGRRLFGTWIGLAAALLLAVSNYAVIYARSALSECDGTLMLLLGSIALEHARRPDRAKMTRRFTAQFLCAGLLFGAAFTINYRMLVYIAVVVALYVFSERLERVPLRLAVPRLLALAAGGAALPLCWAVAGLIAYDHGTILFFNEYEHRVTQYVPQAYYQIHRGKQAVMHFEPFTYAQWYWVRQGAAASLVLAAGLLAALVSKSGYRRSLAGAITLVYVFYINAPFIVPRNMHAAIPLACLLIAATIVHFGRRTVKATWSSGVRAVILGVVVIQGLVLTVQSMRVQSGFRIAALSLAQHGAGKALVTNEIMVFYLRGSGKQCNAARMPSSLARLRADIRAGYWYSVVDRYERSPAQAFISAHAPRMLHIPVLGRAPGAEDIIASENTFAPAAHPITHFVDVYDLRHLHIGSVRSIAASTCRLDTPA